MCVLFFFFNDTATTEIYTFPYTTLFRSKLEPVPEPYLKRRASRVHRSMMPPGFTRSSLTLWMKQLWTTTLFERDRKSTRLNSSHANISYAVFCLKKKKKLLILQSYRHDC